MICPQQGFSWCSQAEGANRDVQLPYYVMLVLQLHDDLLVFFVLLLLVRTDAQRVRFIRLISNVFCTNE